MKDTVKNLQGKTALIVVDVQNDFVEGGALAVKGGKALAHAIGDTIRDRDFMGSVDMLVTTQDWHIDPKDHFSDNPDFVSSWVKHCVADTFGSDVVQYLKDSTFMSIKPLTTIFKGQYDSGYSGFDGVDYLDRSLDSLLKDNGVSNVLVTGIATDYCVRATALSASELGYRVFVLKDLTVGIHQDRMEEFFQVECPANNIIVL